MKLNDVLFRHIFIQDSNSHHRVSALAPSPHTTPTIHRLVNDRTAYYINTELIKPYWLSIHAQFNRRDNGRPIVYDSRCLVENQTRDWKIVPCNHSYNNNYARSRVVWGCIPVTIIIVNVLFVLTPQFSRAVKWFKTRHSFYFDEWHFGAEGYSPAADRAQIVTELDFWPRKFDSIQILFA